MYIQINVRAAAESRGVVGKGRFLGPPAFSRPLPSRKRRAPGRSGRRARRWAGLLSTVSRIAKYRAGVVLWAGEPGNRDIEPGLLRGRRSAFVASWRLNFQRGARAGSGAPRGLGRADIAGAWRFWAAEGGKALRSRMRKP